MPPARTRLRVVVAPILVAVTLAVVAAGCGGPAFQIVRQATPNPLVNVKSYALAPVAWDGLTWNGQPEATWLATRTPEQQTGWSSDKAGATKRMLERFEIEKKSDEQITAAAETPTPGQFVLLMRVKSYNDGMFAWTLEVRDAAGQVVDEIQGPPRGGGFGIAMELNSLLVYAPVDILKYLRTRYAPPSN